MTEAQDRVVDDLPSIGRELAKARRELEGLLRASHKPQLIPFSLAVESGVFDAIGRLDLKIRERGSVPMALAFRDYLYEWMALVRLVAKGTWFLGRHSRTVVVEPPPIRFILKSGSGEDMWDYLVFKSDEGTINDKSDLVSIHPFNLNQWHGALAMVVPGAKEGPLKRQALAFIRMRAKIADVRRINLALERLKSGIRSVAISVDKYGLHHPVDDGSLDSAAEEYFRSLPWEEGGGHLAHRWATDMSEIAEFAQQVAPEKGTLDRALLRKENEAIRRGFASLPRFREEFFREFAVEFDEFCGVLDGLSLVAYERPSDVAVLSRRSFVRRAAAFAGIPQERVDEIVRTLDKRALTSMFRPLIPLSETTYTTSYEWSVYYKLQVLESFFYGSYDFNLRGKAFEDRCRKALEKGGHSVRTRHVVRFPPDLVRELEGQLGFRKTKTDIDLVAYREGVLLLGECKEIKPGHRRRFRRALVRHLLAKDQEIASLAEYGSRSQPSLLSILGPELFNAMDLSINERLVIVPLLVANFLPKGTRLGISNVVTYDDLRSLASIPTTGLLGALDLRNRAKSSVSAPDERPRTRFHVLASKQGIPMGDKIP